MLPAAQDGRAGSRMAGQCLLSTVRAWQPAGVPDGVRVSLVNGAGPRAGRGRLQIGCTGLRWTVAVPGRLTRLPGAVKAKAIYFDG